MSADQIDIVLLSDHSDQRLAALLEKELTSRNLPALVRTGDGRDGLIDALRDDSELLKGDPAYVLVNISTPALREKYYSASSEVSRLETLESFGAQLDEIVARLRRKGLRTIVTTVAAPIERFFGNFAAGVPTSFSAQIQRINEQIRGLPSSQDGVLILDVEHIAATVGLDSWFDDRLWYHAKYPCHPRHISRIASGFASIIESTRGRMIKCVVLDLDNTLWGGVIGDDGLEGIALGGVGEGEAFRDFQRYLKVLQERGILLCVCSKNEESNAKLPFENHDAMTLKIEDMVLFVANWRPKSENISWIAETLNIGIDSILFVDDSLYEREEVRQALPSVTVPEMPEDPALFVRTLEAGGYFETTTLPSLEDAERSGHYRAEQSRRTFQEEGAGIGDFLDSLDLRGDFHPIAGVHLQRAAQLLQRSNQFNLRTQRVTQEQLAGWMDDTDHPCFCVSVRDRFGDYGIIAVICGEVEKETLFIHELVMSCRVLARGVEQFVFNELVEFARREGLSHILGEHLPTPKNGLVAELFPEMGFHPVSEEPRRWALNLDSWQTLPTAVQRAEKNTAAIV